MSETDPLLDAVEALTKEQRTGVAQKNDKTGRWERVHEVTHDPLLKQIRDAVWPSRENNGGASAAPQERVPLDTHMLYEYGKIATQIGSWAVGVGHQPTRDPIRDLHNWYSTVNRDRNLDTSWYVSQMRKWERHITKLLSKTGGFVAHAPCPICGATEWGDVINGGGMFPIRIEYTIEDDGRLANHSALCNACKTVWEGFDAVDELATELAEKRASEVGYEEGSVSA